MQQLNENKIAIFLNDNEQSFKFSTEIGKYEMNKEEIKEDGDKIESELNIDGSTKIKMTYSTAINRLKSLIEADCSAVELFKNKELITTLYKSEGEEEIGIKLRSFLFDQENKIISSFIDSGLTVRITIGNSDDFVHIFQYYLEQENSKTKNKNGFAIIEESELFLFYELPYESMAAKEMLKSIIEDDFEVSKLVFKEKKAKKSNKTNLVNKNSSKIANVILNKENGTNLVINPAQLSSTTSVSSNNRTPFSIISSKN